MSIWLSVNFLEKSIELRPLSCSSEHKDVAKSVQNVHKGKENLAKNVQFGDFYQTQKNQSLSPLHTQSLAIPLKARTN